MGEECALSIDELPLGVLPITVHILCITVKPLLRDHTEKYIFLAL